MSVQWKWLPSLGGTVLIAANTFASYPVSGYAPSNRVAPVATGNVARDEGQQMPPLLQRLTQLSQLIERNAQSPELWKYHLEQADVLLQLAGQSTEKERDGLLRMAVDASYSAAVLCPREQPVAVQRLRQLPQYLAQAFPGNPAMIYALLQGIQADCTLVLERSGGDHAKSEEYRCERLMQFAQLYPEAPEAIKSVQQAAKTRESLGQNEEACHCYRFLVEHFPNAPAARKAEGALWRLGSDHEPIQLQLPLLYVSGSSTQNTFNLDELRGKIVLVYFWASTSTSALEDFQTIRQLTDRYGSRGLEVVYVNMDAESAQARAFLSGQLTAGVHCYQAGGLDSPLAERYGIQELPQAFLIGRDGSVLKHSLPASRLEAELVGNVSHGH
jgi:peroxiredoxin